MIKINELELQEVLCTQENSILCLQFEVENMSLQELEEYFSLNNNTTIEQYENDTLVNRWYYKEFQSIGYEKTTEGWRIKLSLAVTQFQQDDLTSLYSAINEKGQAISALNSSINTHSIQISSILSELQAINTDLTQDNSINENRFISIENSLSRLENNYVSLANRIAVLENAQPQQLSTDNSSN